MRSSARRQLTLGLVSVGYQLSVSMIRLQPTSSVGVTLRRSSGSLIALRICSLPTARPARSAGPIRRPSGRRQLVEREVERAIEALDRRNPREQPLHPLRVREVALRDRPAGGALEHGDVRDLRLDRGHDLDRAAAGADHRHAPAGEVGVVVPARAVERGAGEVVEPRERRDRGRAELPARGDQHVRGVLARARLERPAAVVEARGGHFGARAGRRTASRPPRCTPGSPPAARTGATSAG